MKTESLNAWVLHKRWVGETSARVVFFSQERGVVHSTCRGGRTQKKQSVLQPFTPLWLSLDECRDWFYVRQVEPVGGALSLVGSGLFSALYLNELIYHVRRPHDASAVLYEAYEQTLNLLVNFKHALAVEAALRQFEWVLLEECGHQLLLTHDVNSQPIQARTHYKFEAGHGFWQAESGFSGADLLAFSQGKLHELSTLKVAKRIMRQAIAHLLDGKVIKSRELYQ